MPDTPNAEMLAKKQQWDAAFAPAFVEHAETSADFGYKNATVTRPWNRWQIAYAFADGPFKGKPAKVVAIGQYTTDPTMFLYSYAVHDMRGNYLSL